MREMKSKGNSIPQIIFKVVRQKLLGGPLLLNKGWDWHWKSDLLKQAERIKVNKVKSAVLRQLRRNGYDKHLPKIEVKNGRWKVKGHYNNYHASSDYFLEDVSDLLK